jgi:uncharacterized protein YjbI with pentapeptide repeats
VADGEKTFEDLEKEAELSSNEVTESLTDSIEEEFPDEIIDDDSEDNLEDLGEDSEEPRPKRRYKKQEVPNTAWIDFKKVNLQEDAINLIKKPFYLIVTLLGLLFFVLFVLMFIEYRHEEYAKNLEGYVRVHNKVPEWHKGDLPEHLKEIINEYHLKRRKEAESKQLIDPDPRENDPIIGLNYKAPIDNSTLLEILRKQNIGKVDQEGVVKTELMNLSGLDLSKLSYKFFRNMVAANLRYCNFSDIHEEGLLFRGASLQYSQFVEAAIPKSNFVRAKLSYSNFFEAIADASLFTNATGHKAHFHEARLVDCNFNNAIFLKSDFSKANLDGVSARYSIWEGTDFSHSSLIDVDFRDANLKTVSFYKANLEGANFEGANLEGANFFGANIKNANFNRADVTQTNFSGVKNASFDQLNKAKFLLSARSIPKELVPMKRSWKERFIVPHDNEF